MSEFSESPFGKTLKNHPGLILLWAVVSGLVYLGRDLFGWDAVAVGCGSFAGLILVCIIGAPRASCRVIKEQLEKQGATSSSMQQYEPVQQQTQANYQPPKKEIVMAIQQGSIVNAYGANKELLVSKHGELVGYTSSTVSIYQRQNHLVQVFDVNNQLVATHVEYR